MKFSPKVSKFSKVKKLLCVNEEMATTDRNPCSRGNCTNSLDCPFCYELFRYQNCLEYWRRSYEMYLNALDHVYRQTEELPHMKSHHGQEEYKKYPTRHTIASFSSGLLVCVKSKYSSENLMTVVKILSFTKKNIVYRLLKSYPGPLDKCDSVDSVDSDLIGFCENQILDSEDNSRRILWRLLFLLLDQKGNVRHILLEEVFQNPFSSKHRSEHIKHKQCPTEFAQLERLLLSGDIHSAILFSAENNLWGHAFALESIIDDRAATKMLHNFVDSLPCTSLAKTFYEISLMKRVPSTFQYVGHQFDWRLHAVLLLSSIHDQALVIESFSKLGESLAECGNIYGAIFCFLVPRTIMFGSETQYNEITQKAFNLLTCLLMKPQVSLEEYNKIEIAISLDIVLYIHRSSLNGDRLIKYFLATWFIDYGLKVKAIAYLNSIEGTIEQTPFMRKIVDLRDRLTLCDEIKNNLDARSKDKTIHNTPLMVAIDDKCNASTFIENTSFNDVYQLTTIHNSLDGDSKDGDSTNQTTSIDMPFDATSADNPENSRVGKANLCLTSSSQCRGKDTNELSEQNVATKESPQQIIKTNSKSNWLKNILTVVGKPKNEMHLPDDNNPKIIWDDQKKTWVDLNDHDNSKDTSWFNSLPPPILSNARCNENIYRLSKRRSVKHSYVDILASDRI